eukprot:Rmarinus@m.2115
MAHQLAEENLFRKMEKKRLQMQTEETELARRQEEEEVTGGISFMKNYTPILGKFNEHQDQGDRVRLPSNCVNEFIEKDVFSLGAISLRLSYKNGTRITHAGVLEFTAPANSIELPSKVAACLGVKEEEELPVTIKFVRLQKGKMVRFRARSPAFLQLPQQKSLLEATLRSAHRTLTLGDVVSVRHGCDWYALDVVAAEPESWGGGISLIDTDLSVDIEPPKCDATATTILREQQAHVPLVIGKEESNTAATDTPCYYVVTLDDSLGNRVLAGEKDLQFTLTTRPAEGHVSDAQLTDADLYISTSPYIWPGPSLFSWSSNALHDKNIAVTADELRVNLPADAEESSIRLYIGVHSLCSETSYTICVAAVDSSLQVDRDSVGTKDPAFDLPGEFARCANCEKYVPSQSMQRHEAFCVRHNVRCTHHGCGKLLRRTEADQHTHCKRCGLAITNQADALQKHIQVYHKRVSCPCGVEDDAYRLSQHRRNECKYRLILCRYCGRWEHAGGDPETHEDRLRGFTVHEAACGSRTDICDVCGRPIALKAMAIHMQAAHQTSATLTNAPCSSTTTLPFSANSKVAPPPITTMSNGSESTFQPSAALPANTSSPAHIVPGHDNFSNSALTSPLPRHQVSCPVCGGTVGSERELNSHLEETHGFFLKYLQCSIRFKA